MLLETQFAYGLRVGLARGQELVVLQVPIPHGPISAAHRQSNRQWVECYARNWWFVHLNTRIASLLLQVPYSHLPILPSRGHPFAVRRSGQTVNVLGVAFEGMDEFFNSNIPHLHWQIKRPRTEHVLFLLALKDLQCRHAGRVSFQADCLLRVQVPQVYYATVGTCIDSSFQIIECDCGDFHHIIVLEGPMVEGEQWVLIAESP